MSGHADTWEELRDKLAPLGLYVGAKLWHRKSGTWYRVEGFHYLEATMEIHFTYRTLHRKPVYFSRPLSELLDGRFSITPPK